MLEVISGTDSTTLRRLALVRERTSQVIERVRLGVSYPRTNEDSDNAALEVRLGDLGYCWPAMVSTHWDHWNSNWREQ